MKKFVPLLLAAALLAPAALSAASFEGQVTMKMTGSEGKSQQVSLSLKGNLTRMEMPGGPMGAATVIMDSARRETTIVMAQQRMYMVQALPAPGAIPGGSDPGAPEGPPPAEPVLEKSGVTEKILGYDCVKLITHDKNSTTEIWVTDQLGTFSFLGLMNGGGPMGPGLRGGPGGPRGGARPSPQGWEQLLQGKEMFPLRVVTTKADGKVQRFEVASIEKRSLPDSDFSPPADYQRIDMGNMMRGMGLPPGARPPGGG